MKKVLRLGLIVVIAVALAGCDKELVDLSHKPVNPLPTDSVEIKSDTAYYTVREAQATYNAAISKDVSVVGYIVGDIAGTSVQSAEFESPFNSVSNILIADDSAETNVKRCFPIALAINTEQRTQLNLKNNPHLLKRRIVVRGPLETYFSQVGIRQINSWKFISSEYQMNTDTISHVTDTVSIPISHQAEVVHGGRGMSANKIIP